MSIITTVDQRFEPLSAGKIMILVLALGFSGICYYHQSIHGICCDASSYVDMGRQYLTRGIFPDTSGLRLYGYPLVVSLCVRLAEIVAAPTALVLYVAQVGLYMLAVFLISKRVAGMFSAGIANLVFFALIGNVFVYPYLAIALTDGFSVVLLLFVVYAALRVFSSPQPLVLNVENVLLHVSIGLLVGFAVMVRPSNIHWLLLLLPLTIAWWRCAEHRVSSTAVQIFAMAIGFGVAVAPQLQLNWQTFERFTFLPTRNLGEQQIQWGIAYAKYTTSMINTPAGLRYLNPYASTASEGLSWYLHNPIAGAKTILLHVFAAFDFDYLFPYVYAGKTILRVPLFLLSQLVVFWSLAGYAIVLVDLPKAPAARNRVLLLAASCAALMIGWLAVHAFSAVENRFTLPVITCMLPLAAWMLGKKLWQSKYRNSLLGAFAVYLALAWQLSSFVSNLKIL